MQFTLTGPIIPYVRMTRRGKWVNERAKEYLASQEALAWQFKEQCQGMLPEKTPLMVIAIIETPKLHKGDLDNIFKALADSAQGIVFSNDCWIDSISIQRKQASEYKAQVWIEAL
jgi:Holliday junction resolvase RusA-like endonuclease